MARLLAVVAVAGLAGGLLLGSAAAALVGLAAALAHTGLRWRADVDDDQDWGDDLTAPWLPALLACGHRRHVSPDQAVGARGGIGHRVHCPTCDALVRVDHVEAA